MAFLFENKWGPPPFFHLDTNSALGLVLVHFVDKIHVLVTTVQLIWFLFLNILSFKVTTFFFFLQLFLPMIVHVGNLYLFRTTAAQMLLTPRWVSRQKIRNSYHTYTSKLKFGVLSILSAAERFLPIPI